MKHFIFRLQNGAVTMPGVIRGDHPRIVAWKATLPKGENDTLYVEVPEPKQSVPPQELTELRAYSTASMLNRTLVSRMINSRNDWSRQ